MNKTTILLPVLCLVLLLAVRCGQSTDQNTAFVPPQSLPGQPDDCTLSWLPSETPGVTTYRVLHSVVSGIYDGDGAQVQGLTASCHGIGVRGDDREHYFVVRAVNQYGESDYSNEVSKFLRSTQ